VQVVTSGSVYVARNVTGVMLWMWGPEAGTNHPVMHRHIPKECRPVVCVCVRAVDTGLGKRWQLYWRGCDVYVCLQFLEVGQFN
jgi:hypothetical protein